MRDLTHAERTVLTVIAYHDGPGGARPSLARIAKLAGMKRSTVAEHVKALIEKARITSTHGQHANEYTVQYAAVHCQEFPDTDLDSHCQGIRASQRQEFPDTNRKEPGASESGQRPPDPLAPDGSGQAAAQREAKTKATAKRCRTPEHCAGMMSDAPRCLVCGANTD